MFLIEAVVVSANNGEIIVPFRCFMDEYIFSHKQLNSNFLKSFLLIDAKRYSGYYWFNCNFLAGKVENFEKCNHLTVYCCFFFQTFHSNLLFSILWNNFFASLLIVLVNDNLKSFPELLRLFLSVHIFWRWSRAVLRKLISVSLRYTSKHNSIFHWWIGVSDRGGSSFCK